MGGDHAVEEMRATLLLHGGTSFGARRSGDAAAKRAAVGGDYAAGGGDSAVEEMRVALLLHGGAGFGARRLGGAAAKRAARPEEAAGAEARTVCATRGTSFVGDRLLHHGYNVRLLLETQG